MNPADRRSFIIQRYQAMQKKRLELASFIASIPVTKEDVREECSINPALAVKAESEEVGLVGSEDGREEGYNAIPSQLPFEDSWKVSKAIKPEREDSILLTKKEKLATLIAVDAMRAAQQAPFALALIPAF